VDDIPLFCWGLVMAVPLLARHTQRKDGGLRGRRDRRIRLVSLYGRCILQQPLEALFSA
jgi:hypothetical protein